MKAPGNFRRKGRSRENALTSVSPYILSTSIMKDRAVKIRRNVMAEDSGVSNRRRSESMLVSCLGWNEGLGAIEDEMPRSSERGDRTAAHSGPRTKG